MGERNNVRAVILACQTVREELRLAITDTGCNYPVVYIESGLHNRPESLQRRIQDQLNMIDNVDVVLLVFGYCGNGLLGVKSAAFKMVIPRVDDCIPLLLGSAEARRRISQEMGTYFVTKGWLDYEQNILWEYDRCISRYGAERALRLMKTMLGNYGRFMVIDTGAYPLDSVTPRTTAFADAMGLRHAIAPGSPRLLHKLLTGQWDEEFLVLEPGREIRLDDFCGGAGASPQSLTGCGE
jgi:hypothetical protein